MRWWHLRNMRSTASRVEAEEAENYRPLMVFTQKKKFLIEQQRDSD
jgi:hypothetical protein